MSTEAPQVRQALLRRLSGEERVRLALELTATCFEITRAGIRAQHPSWGPTDVERELRRRLGYTIDESRRAHTAGP